MALPEVLHFLETANMNSDPSPTIRTLTKFLRKAESPKKNDLQRIIVWVSKHWPFSNSDCSPDHILDKPVKADVQNEPSETSFRSIRACLFEVISQLSCIHNNIAKLILNSGLPEKMPSHFLTIMPLLKHQFIKPLNQIQDPHLQQALSILLSLLAICVSLFNHDLEGSKRLFHLTVFTVSELYEPDWKTECTPERILDPIAPSWGSFFAAAEKYITDDKELGLKLMHNGTCAKIRDVFTANPGSPVATLLTYFDHTLADAYARTQGIEEKEEFESREQEGLKLRETANQAFKDQDFALAYDSYKKSSVVWPYEAKTWGNLALCCQKLDRKSEEMEAAEFALEKEPTWWKSWCRAGDALKSTDTRAAALCYTVATSLDANSELKERLRALKSDKIADIEKELGLTKDGGCAPDSDLQMMLQFAYQSIKSNTDHIKKLKPLTYNETYILTCAHFGQRSRVFDKQLWLSEVFTHRSNKPVMIATNCEKPNSKDLARTLFRAMCHPFSGEPGTPAEVLIANRLACFYDDVLTAVKPFGIHVRVETRTEAEVAAIKYNTALDGVNVEK